MSTVREDSRAVTAGEESASNVLGGRFRCLLGLAFFSMILRSRLLCVCLTLVPVLLVGARLFGASLWTCPFHAATGLECPGCGLTRGMALLVEGRWTESLASHPLAGCFLVGWLLMLTAALLPDRWRGRLTSSVERLEAGTGLDLIFAVVFLAHGVVRLGAELVHNM